ncbi:hypothetical protein OL229_21265 [Neisseriaceae bacterium JH1-16]|nr:hypothetical protein [Neisseriaceae bacterium JH1-16]
MTRLLRWNYASAMLKILLIPLDLATCRRHADLARSLNVPAWSALFTPVVSGLWPVSAAWTHYGVMLDEYAATQSHLVPYAPAQCPRFRWLTHKALV